MNRLAAIAMTTSLLASAGARANTILLAQATPPPSATASQDQGQLSITRAGSLPSGRGPAEYFTGAVRVDRLFNATPPSRVSGGLITFEPGARSAWHIHPFGQVLMVTGGLGWVQCDGGSVEEMRPGDVVWIAPGVKHWHGAAATTAVTHIALQEHVDGQVATWMEKVSDEQYRR